MNTDSWAPLRPDYLLMNGVQESPGVWLLPDSQNTLSPESQGPWNLLLCYVINFVHLPSWSIFSFCTLPYLQNPNFSDITSVSRSCIHTSQAQNLTPCASALVRSRVRSGEDGRNNYPRPKVLDPSQYTPFPDRNILWPFPNMACSSLKIPSPRNLKEKPTSTEITSCRLILIHILS